MQRICERCPGLPIAFISVKPSPARFWNIANIRRANSLIQAAISRYPGAGYIDVFSPMLSPEGRARQLGA